MSKKILLSSSLLITLIGCSSNSSAYDDHRGQCEPSKNYIYTDRVELEKLKDLKKRGELKGFYSEILPYKECSYGNCMEFSEKLDYKERYFKEKKFEGLYTIRRVYDITDKKCLPESWQKMKPTKNYCYILEKNENNVIKSDYKYFFKRISYGLQISVYFKDKIILDRVFQSYSNNPIGAHGGGICPAYNNNNPDYEVNTIGIFN